MGEMVPILSGRYSVYGILILLAGIAIIFLMDEDSCIPFEKFRVLLRNKRISAVIKKGNKSTHKDMRCVSLLLFLCFAAGMVRGYQSKVDNGIISDMMDKGNDTDEVCLVRGKILDIEKRNEGIRAIVHAESTRMIAYINDEKEYYPDDLVEIQGKLEEIEGRTNPGAFDMESYWRGRGVTCRIKVSSIDVLKNSYSIRKALYIFREKLAKEIDHIYQTEDASVIKTMLLGDSSDLATGTRMLYQRSGIAHILAISGLHVALIAGFIKKVLKKLRVHRKAASLVLIPILICYGFMTGFSSATLRAVIMISLMEAAFLVGRYPDMPTSMIEALLIIALINPYSVFTSGTLMSFSAALGIMCADIMYRKLDMDKKKSSSERRTYIRRSLAYSLLMSVSINVWMTPLVMNSYYEIPLFSMLLNFAVVPLLSVVIISAVLAILFSFAGLDVHFIVSIGHAVLSIYSYLCRLFLAIPGSTVITGHIEVWQMIIIYVIVGCLVVIFCSDRLPDFRKKSKMFIYYIAVCLGMILSSVYVVRIINVTSNETVFLDVGQGDGSIIHEYDAKEALFKARCYIIDCGSSSTDNVGQYTLIPALKYYAVSEVDCVFISHTDSDHINGITYLLENAGLYGIKVNHIAVAADTSLDGKLPADCVSDVLRLNRGDVINENFEVLYPSGDEAIEHDGNDFSLVLRYHGRMMDIIYTGDIGSDMEPYITVADKSETHSSHKIILKCAHHGSKYSSSEDFLEYYDPDITIISCGRNNIYGHPSEQTLARLRHTGTTIYRTDQAGAIIFH